MITVQTLLVRRKELKRALKEMDQNSIHIKLRREGIEWQFNPPSASHIGSVWERKSDLRETFWLG